MRMGTILFLMIFALNLSAQVIPANRQVNWSAALHCYPVFSPVAEVNVMDYGASGNGTTNDRLAVMSAIASLNGNPG